MPKYDEGKTEVDVLTTSVNVTLSDKQIRELRDAFGLEFRVRSSSEVVNTLVADAVAAHGYDRTHPGYGRNYDRDPNTPSRLALTRRLRSTIDPTPDVVED